MVRAKGMAKSKQQVAYSIIVVVFAAFFVIQVAAYFISSSHSTGVSYERLLLAVPSLVTLAFASIGLNKANAASNKRA